MYHFIFSFHSNDLLRRMVMYYVPKMFDVSWYTRRDSAEKWTADGKQEKNGSGREVPLP